MKKIMKKIIFLSLVFALAANVSAQLTVDAAKNVGIGTTTPKSKLDVVGNINLSGSTADIIAWTSGVPIKFKIGSVLAGNTGSSGQTNVSFGYHALSNTTGSYNTAIGLWADVNTSNLSNTTAVGFDAKVTSSNQVRIGNSSVTGIGGYANRSNFSDKRAKKNIRTDVPGLDFINRLQPVTFNLDLDVIDNLLNIDRTIRPDGEEVPQELIDLENEAREAKESIVQTGFLAQDVEAIAQSIGYDFSGVNVDEAGIYGLRYAEFVALYVGNSLIDTKKMILTK